MPIGRDRGLRHGEPPARELRMSEWEGVTVDRAALVLCAVMYTGIWVQVTLMHWAGGFKKKAMWGPVLATPLFVAAAGVAAISRGGALGWAMAAVLGVAVLEGLTGVVLHLRGIARQVGGFSFRNVLSGPPPILPMAYALIGVLGFGAVVWNA